MAKSKNTPFNIDVVSIQSLTCSENIKDEIDPATSTTETRHITDLLSTNESNSTLNRSVRSVSDNDFRRLKYIIRWIFWPINHNARKDLWMNISTLNRVSSVKNKIRQHSTSQTGVTSLSNVIESNVNSIPWPKFVDTTNLCFYYLTESKGQSSLKDILLTFAYNHPDLTYSPTIQPIAALLLHYHHENDVLFVINRLFVQNRFCAGTFLQWEAICNVFQQLLRHYYVKTTEIHRIHFEHFSFFRNQLRISLIYIFQQ